MSEGLIWRKCDLHLHTGGSHDFVGNVTPKQIVDEALVKGLDAIAVTDHNTGEWIDKVKEVAHGTGLVVFPGVEITCPGGKTGIHLLALFDPSKGANDIRGLLEAVGIPYQIQGEKEAIASESVSDVIEKIAERNGLAIPAHVNSSKGITKEMTGQQRVKLITHPHLIALEATDFHRSVGQRTIDFFDGNDPNYQRKLAVYQASDNPVPDGEGHCLEGIGTRCSFFKLDIINLEGLRQCFVHPEARIAFNLEEQSYNRIMSLRVGDGGFLGSQEFTFHQGLNSIIGGKGVGKSLVIEFLRFCLGVPSSDKDLFADHQGKLEKQLGHGNEVEIVYQLSSGARYKISRTYQGPKRNSEIHCVNLDTGRDYEGDIVNMFPILAYSQTEVIKIAENQDAQLELIDQFIDERAYVNNIESIKDDLVKNDRSLAEAIACSARLEQTDKDIKTLDEKIFQLDELFSNELFVEMKKAEEKDRLLKLDKSNFDILYQSIKDLSDTVEVFNLDDLEQEWSQDKEIVEQRKYISSTIDTAKKSLATLIEATDKHMSESRKSVDEWELHFSELRKKYEAFVSEQGGDQKQQELQRQKLEEERTKLSENAKHDRKIADQLEQIASQRDDLLDKLEQAYKNYYDVRNEKFIELTNASDGRLRLTLKHAENREQYEKKLSGLLRGGENAPSVGQRRQIAQNIEPRKLIDLVLFRNTDELCKKANITELWAQRVIERLWSYDNFSEVLALQYSCFPEDVPVIEYAKSENMFSELSELSVGQKCTALLIIALSEGRIPVIIDQPEDALDIVSVWQDVGSKLLDHKQRRQFILTTHNSSVAVSADSDQFFVLNADATKARVVERGAIDRESVKSAVIEHLEGGDEPYALRQDKYNKRNITKSHLV